MSALDWLYQSPSTEIKYWRLYCGREIVHAPSGVLLQRDLSLLVGPLIALSKEGETRFFFFFF